MAFLLILAVFTGASDGIGKGFVLQLDSTSFDVLLVTQNHAVLSDVADKIGAELLKT